MSDLSNPGEMVCEIHYDPDMSHDLTLQECAALAKYGAAGDLLATRSCLVQSALRKAWRSSAPLNADDLLAWLLEHTPRFTGHPAPLGASISRMAEELVELDRSDGWEPTP